MKTGWAYVLVGRRSDDSIRIERVYFDHAYAQRDLAFMRRNDPRVWSLEEAPVQGPVLT